MKANLNDRRETASAEDIVGGEMGPLNGLAAPSVAWDVRSDKAEILAAIFRGQASSRRELVQLLGLRSSSVSEMVAELLDVKLLTETVDRRSGRGRPSLSLVGNPHRVAVIVFAVTNQAMFAYSVNLLGQVLVREAAALEEQYGNEEFAAIIVSLTERVRAQTRSTTELAGACFSLPGLIGPVTGVWSLAARWRGVRDLDLKGILAPFGLPVYVSRSLDAELRARVARERKLSGRTMLFHWGYGIGAAFASDGVVRSNEVGAFGEVGHWRWSDSGMQCRCGRRGCLATTCALWALAPSLLGERYDARASEEAVTRQLMEQDLLRHAEVRDALKQVVMALANLCRTLFPQTVIVGGPFVANVPLWLEFREAVAREGVLFDLPVPTLISDQFSHHFELLGAARPMLTDKLERLCAGETDF
jgi:predicted NBD/HSP70 family sugar kinase